MTLRKMMMPVGILALMWCTITHAQESLSLNDAIRIGLENNYSIHISKSDTKIAENNVSLGNAGMLPRIDASAAIGNTVANVDQELASGQSNVRTGATSSTRSAGIALTWTLFDGFKMFTSYDKLKEIQRVGDIAYRNTVETTLSQIITQYYNVIAEKNTLDALRETVDVSQKRLDISKSRTELGADSKQKLLQATIDFNEDRAAFLRQKVTLERSKITLNQLLARNSDKEFEPSDSLVLKPKFTLDDLRQKSLANNTLLQLAIGSKNIAEYDAKLLNSGWYPSLSLASGLNYSKSQSQFGAVSASTSLGFTYGLTASVNLFEGGNLRRQSENARLLILSNEENIALVKQQVESDVSRTYRQYNATIELVQLETENMALTKQNVEISLQRYSFGNMTEFEFRQTQKSMTDAENRTIKSLYDAKIAETELLRLSGGLVNQ